MVVSNKKWVYSKRISTGWKSLPLLVNGHDPRDASHGQVELRQKRWQAATLTDPDLEWRLTTGAWQSCGHRIE